MCVFSRFFLARFSSIFTWAASSFVRTPLVIVSKAFRTSCSVRRAYQTSMLPIWANSAMASRYAFTDASVTPVASAFGNPL